MAHSTKRPSEQPEVVCISWIQQSFNKSKSQNSWTSFFLFGVHWGMHQVLFHIHPWITGLHYVISGFTHTSSGHGSTPHYMYRIEVEVPACMIISSSFFFGWSEKNLSNTTLSYSLTKWRLSLVYQIIKFIIKIHYFFFLWKVVSRWRAQLIYIYDCACASSFRTMPVSMHDPGDI